MSPAKTAQNRYVVSTLATLTLAASVALGGAPPAARADTPAPLNGGTLTCDATTCTDTFGVDGATPGTAVLQTFVVPPSVTAVTATVDGAGATFSPAGGRSTGTLATTGGTAYQVLVGAQGYRRNGKAGTPATAGGGGAGGNSLAANGGESGGGGSFVFDVGGALLLAAGGAGGAGGVGDPTFVCAGGTGGGAGADASDSARMNSLGYSCGSGGDAQGSTPGAGTDTYPGSPGGQASGTTPGSGGSGASEYQATYSAGGGGGGYAGGAGGSATYDTAQAIINTPGGGGGGSGYAAPSLTGVTGVAGGGSTGDGSVTFTWASTFGSTSCVAATAGVASQCTDAFGTTSAPQAFVVPPGVSSLTTTALGAGYQIGGGMSVGTLASPAGTVLPVLVGASADGARTLPTAGGGGLGGGTSGISGATGNGGSFLFDATGAPLLVAGGEGGNAPFTGCQGGAGGSAVTPAEPATAVYRTNVNCHPGQPGTTSGGAGGSAGAGGLAGADGEVSAAFTAGLGGTGGSTTGQGADELGGGGGGGGYAGAGGGGGVSLTQTGDRAGGGGGGSGYAAPNLTTVSGVSGSHTGNGQLNVAFTSGATQVTAPGAATTATAGTPFTVSVVPAAATGEPTPWGGSVQVTSGDPHAVLPSDATFSGQTSASASVTFHTAGMQTVTLTDRAGRLAPVTVKVFVSPGPASQLLLSPATADVQIGTAQSYSSSTADQYGNVIAADTATTYTIDDTLGTCTTTSCTPVTPGSHTVTGKDGALTGTAMLTGDALATTSLAATVPAGSSTTAGGAAVTVTVTPGGAVQGLPATYTGQVMFSSSDPHAVLPATQTFTAAPNGSETFQVTFKTAGMQTVTVSDPASRPPGGVGAVASGTTGAVTVTPAAVAALTATTTATTATAGDSAHPVPVTVRAYDSYGNIVPSYRGTVHLTSTDPRAVLPPDHAFTAGDAGTHSYQVTLATAGGQTVTAADPTSHDNVEDGTTGTVMVNAGPADHLVLSPPQTQTQANTGVTYSAVSADAEGNAIGADTTVTYTITPDGSCTGSVCTPTASGPHTVTGTDTSNSAVRGTAALTATTDPATHFVLSPVSTSGQEVAMPVTAGTSSYVTVTAQDAANKPVPFSGTVTVTSDDTRPQAASVRTATHMFTGQSAYSFTMTVTKTPTTTYTATSDDPSVTSGLLTLNGITPGPAATLALSPARTSALAGQGQAYTATGTDGYGNGLGDVTAATRFAIAPDGTCTGSACQAAAAGTHGVTGTDAGASGTAELDATAPAAPVGPAPVPPAPVPPAPVPPAPVPPAPVPPAPVLTLRPSAPVIGYGKKVTLTGRLTQAGTGLAGQRVVLTDTFTGDRTKPIGAATTGPDGSWRLVVAPAYNGVVVARSLATSATTKVGVRESYNHLKVAVSETTVTITGRLTPGFVPTATTKLGYVITATSGKKVLTRTVTAPQRELPRRINHGYIPLTVQFDLPVGHYRLTLTVTGVPASTPAPSSILIVTIHEPKVLTDRMR